MDHAASVFRLNYDRGSLFVQKPVNFYHSTHFHIPEGSTFILTAVRILYVTCYLTCPVAMMSLTCGSLKR